MRWLACVLLAACARPAPVAAVDDVKVVTADTPWTDADGNAFVVPAGWAVSSRDGAIVIAPPEPGSRITLVDVAAPTGEAARDAAMAIAAPGNTRAVIQMMDAPERDGWTGEMAYEYATSPNEQRIVQAITRFANGRWLVVVADVAVAVAEKRHGQLGVIFGSLYPKGYAPESFAGRRPAVLDAARIAALRTFVVDAEAVTHIPGVSFGVIQDGKVVWAGGIGVRDMDRPEPVDARTLYLIASNTKPLTTLMLAKLVDAGRLSWDTPVASLLPGFRLGSDEVTRQVQVKHLICACTGMPRQDLEWLLEWGDATPASLLAALGTMVPTSRFGELYQYSNLMAAAGGYVGAHAAFPALELGAAYDRAMQALVFDPLGMAATTFDFATALRGNHAVPHGIDFDGVLGHALMAENYAVVPARPAAGAWSNVDDMLRYVALELADGKLPDGAPYVGREALRARRAPGITVNATTRYGMGLYIATKYGVTVIDHGGDLIGFHSDALWLPEANVGAVILTNGELGGLVSDEFQRKLLEVLYDGKPEADENVAVGAQRLFSGIRLTRAKLAIPAAGPPLASRYHNDRLGELVVTHPDGKTVFDFGEVQTEVGTRANPDGTVSFITLAMGLAGYELVAGEGGETLTIRDGQHAYVFVADGAR